MLGGNNSNPWSGTSKTSQKSSEIDFQSLLDDLEETENMLRQQSSESNTSLSKYFTPPQSKSVLFVDESKAIRDSTLLHTVQYDESDPTCIISYSSRKTSHSRIVDIPSDDMNLESVDEPTLYRKDEHSIVLLATSMQNMQLESQNMPLIQSRKGVNSILKVKTSSVVPDYLPAEPFSEDDYTDTEDYDSGSDGDMSEASSEHLSPIETRSSSLPASRKLTEEVYQIEENQEQLVSSPSSSSGTETESFTDNEDNASVEFHQRPPSPPPKSEKYGRLSPGFEKTAASPELSVGPRVSSNTLASVRRVPSASRPAALVSSAPSGASNEEKSPVTSPPFELPKISPLDTLSNQLMSQKDSQTISAVKKPIPRLNSVSKTTPPSEQNINSPMATTPETSSTHLIEVNSVQVEETPKVKRTPSMSEKSKTPTGPVAKSSPSVPAPEIKKITTRIYIEDARSFKTLVITSLMTAEQVVKDVIEGLHLESSPDWTLFELCNDLGIERPLRDWELVTDVLSSWNIENSLNAIVMKKYVYRATVTPRSLNGRFPRAQGFLQLQTRPGKWQKKFCVLKDANLYYYAESEDPNSLILVCNLTSFDVYTLSQAQKTPTDFCFAVRSTNNPTFFEKKDEYCRILCVEKVERLYDWVFALRLAKSEKSLLDFPEKFQGYSELSEKARLKLQEAIEEKERRAKDLASGRTVAAVADGGEPLLGRSHSVRRAEKAAPAEGYTNFGSRKPSVKGSSSRKAMDSHERHKSPSESEYEFAMKEKERRRAERTRAGSETHRPKHDGSSSSSSRHKADGHSATRSKHSSSGEKAKRSRKLKPLVDISDLNNCRQCGCSEFRGIKGNACSNCFHVHLQ